MSSRSSRIPRSATIQTNENAAPTASSKPSLAGKTTAAPATRSRIPSASSLLSKQNASRLPKSSSARTLRPTPSQAQLLVRGEPVEPTPAYSSLVGIALQLPTSDDAVEEVKNAFLDEREDEQVDEEQYQQMPTPPNSQSPPKGGKRVERSESGGKLATATTSRLPRTRTASSSQLAPPAASKPRRSSRSPSAQIVDEPIPAGPAHAPHVIAARRRSSISPLPPPAQSSSQPSLAKGTSRACLASSTSSARVTSPKPSATATSASSAKKSTTSKRSKLRPRPSEILPEPITLDSSEDDGLDDPLLLYGPEQTRGRGEGKQGTSRAGFRRAAGGTPVPGKGVLRRASDAQVEVKEESMEKEEQEMEMEPPQEEDEQPVDYPEAPVEEHMPVDLTGEEQQDQPQEEDFGGGFDDHHYQDDADFAAGFDQHEAREEEEQADLSQYGQTDGFLPLQDPSSGSEADPEEEQQHFEEEEEERKSPSPPLPAVTTDAQPLPSADVDADPPSSDITYASPSPPHSPRQRGRPLQARPSYPPLDPEESGEWDAEVPVRLGSSPVRGESREPEAVDEGDEEEEVEEEVDQVEEVKVELEVEVEVAEEPAPEQDAHPAAPETTDAALSVPAPPSTGYRSPSPAVLSPFFRHPASISPAPQSVPRRSTPSLSFASPRRPRDRYPHLAVPGVPSPAGAAIAPRSLSVSAAAPLAAPPSSAAASSRSWTRGPAFFRSSSFSPPPHAEQPRSATLFTRHPGREGSEAPSAAGEQSREYHRFGDLTPTSPHVDEIRELREEIRAMGKGAEEEFEADGEGDEQDEEEEEQVVLVGDEEQALERARSKSATPPRQPEQGAHKEEESAPPTPAKDYDIRMSSPAASIRSRLGNSPSPPRSPNGDVLMSSPSPPAGSPVAQQSPLRASFANSPSPPSLESKKLPATPSAAGAHEADMDAKMRSPSPAKMVASGSGSMRRIGGIVEVGREKLQGLLFGPRASVAAEAEQVEQVEQPEQEGPEEENEDDQPFPQPAHLAGPSHSIARAPASLADESTFSTSHSNSNLSVISSTSRRSRRRRPSRPSHPTLPVIEISSTDAKAAARAAAILKCYHDYIEQGVEAVEAGEKSVRRVDAAEERDEDDDEEEELRTLLLDAEDEVRAQLPRRRRSESGASPSDDGTASSGTPPAEQPAPQPAAPSTDQLRRTSAANSTLSSIANTTSWTSSEWRRLEQTLVEVGRRYRRGTSVSSISAGGESFVTNASAVGEEVDAEVVVEAFLRKWGVAREECEGQWAWDTLVTRVNALKTRRAKDVRLKRASSVSSTSTSLYSKAPLPPPSTQRKSRELPNTLEEELRRASSPVSPDQQDEQEQSRSDEGEDEEERSPSPAPTVVKQEVISEHGGDEPSGDVTSSDEEEDHESRQLEDDTFFGVGRSTKERRARRTSVQPVYLPTALSNPALRHLYDDDTPPEKVKVPVRDYLRDDSPSSADGEGDESAEQERWTEEPRQRETTTPEQDDREPSQPPSSASRLFSYLGSFVRRSPAPEPSPSSTRVAPPTPAAGSPEASLSPSPEQPEMSEVKLHASVVTPRFASTSKAFPPVPGANKSLPHPGDRKILPLPPSHFPQSASSASLSTPQPVAYTSKVTLDGPAGARTAPQPFRRRRRSSGENSRVWEVVNAIEEAESSREEEEARIIELLQSGGAKRRAAAGDLREREEGVSGKGKGKAREVEWRGFVEVEKSIMIPAGTRALDRRPSGELRATRR